MLFQPKHRIDLHMPPVVSKGMVRQQLSCNCSLPPLIVQSTSEDVYHVFFHRPDLIVKRRMEYESAKPKQQNVWRPKENTHSHFELQHITYYTITIEITDGLAWKYLGNVFYFESPFSYCLFKSRALLNCNHEHEFEFRNQEDKLFKII